MYLSKAGDSEPFVHVYVRCYKECGSKGIGPFVVNIGCDRNRVLCVWLDQFVYRGNVGKYDCMCV